MEESIVWRNNMEDSKGLKLPVTDLDSEQYESLVREFLIETCGIDSPSEELIALSTTAFTTPDYSKEYADKFIFMDNSDRLEFYGDGVVKHIICEELYRNFPKMNKGNMTSIAEHLWSNKTYPECMYQAGVKSAYLLRISKGLRGQDANSKSTATFSKISNSFEALIGALDRTNNYDVARRLVIEVTKE